MTPETLKKLQDFRSRIVRAKALEAAEEPVPEGLVPSDDEIRESLIALRQNRGETTARKPAPSSTDFDLNELFK